LDNSLAKRQKLAECLSKSIQPIAVRIAVVVVIVKRCR
jgi:hypothetical protein